MWSREEERHIELDVVRLGYVSWYIQTQPRIILALHQTHKRLPKRLLPFVIVPRRNFHRRVHHRQVRIEIDMQTAGDTVDFCGVGGTVDADEEGGVGWEVEEKACRV